MREVTNAAERSDSLNKVRALQNIVDVHITNLTELKQLLSSIAGGIHTWTVDQQNVSYAHLDILDDAICACWNSTVRFQRRMSLMDLERATWKR